MKSAGSKMLITGGTSGIGLALARQAAARGADVIVCGRDGARLEAAGDAGLRTIRADIASPSDRARLIAELEREGGLDILVNNAGVQRNVVFADGVSDALVSEEVEINLTAPIALCTLALPGLLRREAAMIVNVTSGLALAPKRSAPVYCATKAGLRAFTKALRYQLEGSTVRVIEALPPLVDTPMTSGRGRGKITAETCAEAILDGMEREQSEIYVGKVKALRAAMWIAPPLGYGVMRDA